MAFHYHSGCDDCCAMGRCHWCLTRAGSVVLFFPQKGFHVHACVRHAELVRDSDKFPKGVVVGYDGTFRPKEIVVDDEAAKRARDSIHGMNINQGTPVTLL